MGKFKRATDTLVEVFIYYVIIMFVSAWLFHWIESVPIEDALYWSGITMTTVGYGDISPHTVIGKILSVVLANITIFFLAPLIVVRMLEHLVDDSHELTYDEKERIKLRLSNIEDNLSVIARNIKKDL